MSRSAAFVILVSATVLAGPGTAQAPASDEQAIRSARALSNRAIVDHDLDAIAGFWMPDVHIVTSTSAQASGIAPNRERMARQFATRPDTVYERKPGAVDVLAAWAVASETGDWTGRWTDEDGAVEVAGRYQAQWRKRDGQWRIQAELFVPTRCRGGRYCSRHP